MRQLAIIMFICVSLFSINVFADEDVEPVVSNNVHVLHNVTPSQCPTSWRGSAGSADITSDTGYGVSNSQVGAGIRSCDGCKFDQATSDCVCATCYDNFN